MSTEADLTNPVIHDAYDPYCGCQACINRKNTVEHTIKQLRLRDLCDEIAKSDGINTFHFMCVFNDGIDCEYEYLNDDATIYAIELLRDHGAAVETYTITVKRNLRDDDGFRSREWFVESTSTMVAES